MLKNKKLFLPLCFLAAAACCLPTQPLLGSQQEPAIPVPPYLTLSIVRKGAKEAKGGGRVTIGLVMAQEDKICTVFSQIRDLIFRRYLGTGKNKKFVGDIGLLLCPKDDHVYSDEEFFVRSFAVCSLQKNLEKLLFRRLRRNRPYVEELGRPFKTIQHYKSFCRRTKKRLLTFLPRKQKGRKIIKKVEDELGEFCRFLERLGSLYGNKCNLAQAVCRYFYERFRKERKKRAYEKNEEFVIVWDDWVRLVLGGMNALRDAFVVTQLCAFQKKQSLKNIFVFIADPLLVYQDGSHRKRINKMLCEIGYVKKYGPRNFAEEKMFMAEERFLDSGESIFWNEVHPERKPPMRDFIGNVVYCCDICGKHKEKMKLCARCKLARYCSKECQKKAWKEGHKDFCVAPKEEGELEVRISCRDCGEPYPDNQSILQHCLQMGHGIGRPEGLVFLEPPMMELAPEEQMPDLRIFRCLECPMQFTNKDEWEGHAREMGHKGDEITMKWKLS